MNVQASTVYMVSTMNVSIWEDEEEDQLGGC